MAAASVRSVPKVVVIGVGALVLLLGAFFAWRTISAAAEAAAQRQAAIDAAEVELAKSPLDVERLGRAITAIKKLPEADTDNALLMLQARIELARDRAEVAEELFGDLGTRPGASNDEQRLAARILLRRQEADLGERALEALARVRSLSEQLHRSDGRADDLFRAWLAAQRANQRDAAKELAQTMQAQHADTPERRFIAFATTFDPAAGVAAVEAAAADLTPQPAEKLAMVGFAQLQAADLGAAARTAEDGLMRAPGVVSVRYMTAVVFHGWVMASAADSADRQQWVQRRDAQLDWLTKLAYLDDGKRTKCREMAAVR